MKLIFTLISLLVYIILFAPTVDAQVVHKLNTINTQSKQATAKTVSGAVQERQYFTLHDDRINFSDIGDGDIIEVEVKPGEVSSFLVSRVANYTPSTTSFITASTENPENTFTFTYSDGMMHGLYHESHSSTYFFEFDKDASQNYVSKTSSFYDDRESCSIHEVDHNISSFNGIELDVDNSTSMAKSGRTHVPSTAAMVSSLSNETIVDVMLVYTANAKIWAESSTFGTIDNLISSAMALSQSALDNSDTNITLRLVHYYQTSYSDDTLENLSSSDPDYVSAGDHLRRLTRNDENPFDLCSGSSGCQESDFDGYFEDAHRLRDQYGADLVAGILSEPNTGGIAWVNNSTAGSPALGFSINRVQQIATNYTLVHEFGHNIGNVHARNQNSAEASEFGGLFIYSTGNLFSGPEGNYATVMGYDDSIFQTIPYFSNPDIEYFGAPTGNPITSTSEAGPSDNARSMREIKNVIASYRPTTVAPPVTSIDVTSISASLNQENQTATVPITIQNSGASELMWDIDFDIESDVVATKRRSVIEESVQTAETTETTGLSGNHAFTTQMDEPGVIFQTSFETNEGYVIGDSPSGVGWRSFSTNVPFEISDSNPFDGSSHLRLPHRQGASGSVFSRSPFFGPQPMGEFLISFDAAIEKGMVINDPETFDAYFFEGVNGEISSGLIIVGQQINVRNTNEVGRDFWSSTGALFPDDGSYQNVKIHYNPNDKSIDYYLNDALIASNPYPRGRKPDYAWFGQRNEVGGAYMDVDNLRIERLHSPFNWLTTETFAGIIAPGESETVNLTLNAVDVETGSYETILQVRSNDPNNPVIEVPITASIEMATSSEILSDVPQTPTLSQNYPNPFNPTTNIEFTLNRASDVTLEVFNITGQKVATLVQDRMPAGSHQQRFDASGLASGIYMYRLTTDQYMMTRQMILIK